jgi:hypothetical protein
LATLLKNVDENILMRKNIGKLPKNVEKKCWQHLQKMLTKNIGNTSEKC